jgi:hypothetical protein
MHTTQAIRLAFFRFGLHTAPKGIVGALAQQGMHVNEELVRQVRFEMLKQSTRRVISKTGPVPSPGVRHRPQG